MASAATVAVATWGCAAAKRRRSVRSRLTRPRRSACSSSSPAVSGSSSAEPFRAGQRGLGRDSGRWRGREPVEDQPGQRHRLGRQPLDEERRLAQGVRVRRGHHQERRLPVLEDLVGLVRPGPETPEQGVEGGHERLDVAQHLPAEHLADRAGHHGHARREQPGRSPRRSQQYPDQPAVEERGQPFWGVQEVESGPGRWRVDHDQVPSTAGGGLGPELAELLHRHVLLGAGERARQRLVERVLVDLLGLVGRRVGRDDLVEGPFHVEHHRVEAAALRRIHGFDRARDVVELGEPHRLGQPPCRVDGQHDDLPPGLGGLQRKRRGRRRLADSPRPAADHDADGRVRDQCVEIESRYVGEPSGHRPDPGLAASTRLGRIAVPPSVSPPQASPPARRWSAKSYSAPRSTP